MSTRAVRARVASGTMLTGTITVRIRGVLESLEPEWDGH